jgi:DNA-directed RNA polymerase subunit RPC12/RpoP
MSGYALRANYACPECGRNALMEAPDEIVAYKCATCGERVREGDT